jgi:hypothetical protein
MLRVDCRKWGQTPDDLRRLAVEGEHPRTRERFLALYQIAQGWSATSWAEQTERHDDTVQHWVHSYNEHGPEELKYRRTGGRPPSLLRSSKPLANRSGAACRPRHAET